MLVTLKLCEASALFVIALLVCGIGYHLCASDDGYDVTQQQATDAIRRELLSERALGRPLRLSPLVHDMAANACLTRTQIRDAERQALCSTDDSH